MCSVFKWLYRRTAPDRIGRCLKPRDPSVWVGAVSLKRIHNILNYWPQQKQRLSLTHKNLDLIHRCHVTSFHCTGSRFFISENILQSVILNIKKNYPLVRSDPLHSEYVACYSVYLKAKYQDIKLSLTYLPSASLICAVIKLMPTPGEFDGLMLKQNKCLNCLELGLTRPKAQLGFFLQHLLLCSSCGDDGWTLFCLFECVRKDFLKVDRFWDSFRI